jgi:hypothetical protein
MITYEDIGRVISEITYKPDWTIALSRDGWSTGDGRPYVQVAVSNGIDSVTGDITHWRGAKHYLSYHMCRQEIVGVVFKAIRDAEEHEMREWFRYRNCSIYNPHLDPDALVIVARHADNFIMRENAMSMEES